MCLPLQDGQTPRPLQLAAGRAGHPWPRPAGPGSAGPPRRIPCGTSCRPRGRSRSRGARTRDSAASRPCESALEVLRDDLMERRLLGPTPLVAAGCRGASVRSASASRGKPCDRGDLGRTGPGGGQRPDGGRPHPRLLSTAGQQPLQQIRNAHRGGHPLQMLDVEGVAEERNQAGHVVPLPLR